MWSPINAELNAVVLRASAADIEPVGIAKDTVAFLHCEQGDVGNCPLAFEV